MIIIDNVQSCVSKIDIEMSIDLLCARKKLGVFSTQNTIFLPKLACIQMSKDFTVCLSNVGQSFLNRNYDISLKTNMYSNAKRPTSSFRQKKGSTGEELLHCGDVETKAGSTTLLAYYELLKTLPFNKNRLEYFIINSQKFSIDENQFRILVESLGENTILILSEKWLTDYDGKDL